MRIKITEIEANADDLRCSQSLSASFSDLLRKAFIPNVSMLTPEEEADDEDQDN